LFDAPVEQSIPPSPPSTAAAAADSKVRSDVPAQPAHADPDEPESISASDEPLAQPAHPANEQSESATSQENSTPSERKRLEQQLDALKRKETEIRRALALADHPELGEAVRVIEGRVFALSRADTKVAQGVSKGEARRRETIEKKLGSLREKRAELEQQITTLESELSGLGSDRLAGYQAERREALEQLLVAVASHDTVFSSASVEAAQLIPDLARWLPDLEALAKQLDAAHPRTEA
jgi:chromosome segregation ATPase